jgi:hypothetical protein
VARAAGLPAADVLAGRTDLGELAALVAHARLVVSNDTGIAHLATAFGTASVVIFGPMAPSLWGPPPGRPWHVALWAGQRGSPFAAEPHPGLLEITVPDVLAGVRTALAAATSAGRTAVPADRPAEATPARQEAVPARQDAVPARHDATLARHDATPARHDAIPARHDAVPAEGRP